MPILIVVLQHWKAVLLGLLLVFIFALLAALNAKNSKIAKLQAEHARYIEQSELTLLKANIVSKTIAEKYQAKLAEANQNAIVQIKAANDAADSARDAVTSLRKQTNTANAKLPTATNEAAIDYAIACGTVLDDLAKTGGAIAAKADGHAIDAERSIKAWPE